MDKAGVYGLGAAGPVVGIPRALTFYKNAAKWVAMLTGLGARVVLSRPTNKVMLDDGVELATDESCLPVKLYLGHIRSLIHQQPNYILVCRQQDFSDDEVLCTKLWGIPDICRNTFVLPGGCRWLELNVSPSIDGITDYKAWQRVARCFTRNPLRVRAAYRRALVAQDRYEAWQKLGKSPMRALESAIRGDSPSEDSDSQETPTDADSQQIQIALLGHPYLIFDQFIGMPLMKLLRQLGAKVHVVEGLDPAQCRARGREISPHLYWTYNREIVGAAGLYLGRGIDGLILVEAFPCGPDALALEYAVRKLRGSIPIVRLVLDELQALSGIQTRLESFIDVLRMRGREVANG